MYQSPAGGPVVVPLESNGRIIGGTATPRLSKMVSWKYSEMSALDVGRDMAENHCRPLSREFVQSLSSKVADLAADKEFEWVIPQYRKNVPAERLGIDRGQMGAILGIY